MSDQIQNLLKYAQKNPELLSKAMSFVENNADIIKAAPALANTVQNVMSPTSMSVTEPVQAVVSESLQNVGQADNIAETINAVNTLFNLKYIIIGIIVCWAIVIIAVRYSAKTEEAKKDIEFINTTLFGNNGVVPIILSIWVISLLAVTLLPALIDVLPKVSVLSGALSTFLVELPKLIPALL